MLAGLAALGALVGTPVGARLLGRLPLRALRLGFAAVLLVTAARMLLGETGGDGRAVLDVAVMGSTFATGLLSGLLAGVRGVGGGVVLVPVFALLFGLPLVLAKGTSLAVIVPGALAGTFRNLAQGTTDLRTGAVTGVGGVVAAFLASQLSLDLDPRLSSVLFGLLLVVAAARIALRR